MIYVTAALHGYYDKYMALIKEIDLKKDDVLFVLGDIVDGGDKGIEILMDMMMRDNVFPILGEHDLIAYEVLSGIASETKDDITAPLSKELADRCNEWVNRGGEGTLEGFAKLSDDDKEALLEYMEEFTIYEEVEAGGIEYVLCHNMPDNFFIDDELENYSAEDILTGSIDYDKEYFSGKVLVTGEDITIEIDRNTHGRIFKNEYHVGVNCGGYLGGLTAAYCLDTGEEFYVN